MNILALVTSFFELSTALLERMPDQHQKMARELYNLTGLVQRYTIMPKDDSQYSADAHLNAIDQLVAFNHTLAQTIKKYNEQNKPS